MRKLLLVVFVFGVLVAFGRASTSTEKLTDYLPQKAAPDHHKPILENAFVLVLAVSIPAAVTVPAHVHPWPAVFITLQPAHLVFRNLAGEVVREVRPPIGATEDPKVEWRERDTDATSVTNVGPGDLRALRIELNFLRS